MRSTALCLLSRIGSGLAHRGRATRPSRTIRISVITLSILFWVGFVEISVCGRVWAETLPSWNEGPAKAAIVDFVARVTKEGGPDFVPPAERIAVFDNDGTLWAEQPVYFQLQFALDRVKALSP